MTGQNISPLTDHVKGLLCMNKTKMVVSYPAFSAHKEQNYYCEVYTRYDRWHLPEHTD